MMMVMVVQNVRAVDAIDDDVTAAARQSFAPYHQYSTDCRPSINHPPIVIITTARLSFIHSNSGWGVYRRRGRRML